MPTTVDGITIGHALPVRRGCGERQVGGIYIETSSSQASAPLTILDPPVPVPDAIEVPTQGMGFIRKNGIYHLIDRVGEGYYPNVADFIEEVRRFGLSRRIQRSFPFELLTRESRILLVHRRAFVANFMDYEDWRCPFNISSHSPSRVAYGRLCPCCAGVWWRDLTGRDLQTIQRYGNLTNVRRVMPSFSYEGYARPDNVTPQYMEAFFATMPISGISVIRDDLGTHVEALQAIGNCPIPTLEVDR